MQEDVGKMQIDDTMPSMAKYWASRNQGIAVGIVADWAYRTSSTQEIYFATVLNEVLPEAQDPKLAIHQMILLSVALRFEPQEILTGLDKAISAAVDHSMLGVVAEKIVDFWTKQWGLDYDQINILLSHSVLLKAIKALSVLAVKVNDNRPVTLDYKGDDHVTENQKRQLQHFIEQENIIEEKLHCFKKEAMITASAPQMFEMEHRIKKLKQDLASNNSEYAQLLSQFANDSTISTEAAEIILGELQTVVVSVQRSVAVKSNADLSQCIKEITENIQAPGRPVVAKLKMTLPLIPLLLRYEFEVDTQSTLTLMWKKLRNLFGGS